MKQSDSICCTFSENGFCTLMNLYEACRPEDCNVKTSASKEPVCKWELGVIDEGDEYCYDTDCSRVVYLLGSVSDNGFIFCPYCRRIVTVTELVK